MNTRNILRLAAFGIFGLIANMAQAATPEPVCPAIADEKNMPGDEYLAGTFEGKDGWFFAPKRVQKEYTDSDTSRIGEMSDSLKRAGTTLYVVPLPIRNFVYWDMLPDTATAGINVSQIRGYYSNYVKNLQDYGVKVFDYWKILDSVRNEGDVYFKADHHWTPLGSFTVALTLAENIKSDPAFSSSNIEFKIVRDAKQERNGSFYKGVKQACPKVVIKDDIYEPVRSKKVESADDVGLLDDVAYPKVVLAGTSFSGDEELGFAPYLRETLKEDVLNVAVSGGGVTTALKNYLPTDNFKLHPPQYLIWENETPPKLSEAQIREFTGMINGSCDESPVSTYDLATNSRFRFDSTIPNFAGPNYYLQVKMADISVRKLTAEFMTAQGKKVSYNLEIPSRADATGVFYTELPRGAGEIRSVSLSSKGAPNLAGSVNLCKSRLYDVDLKTFSLKKGSAASNTFVKKGKCTDVAPFAVTGFAPSSGDMPPISVLNLMEIYKKTRGLGCTVTMTSHIAPGDNPETAKQIATARADALATSLKNMGFDGNVTIADPVMEETPDGKVDIQIK